MTYDMKDFESPDQLVLCISSQDNITLVDGYIILPDDIRKVWFSFEVSGSTKRHFLSEVRYCKKLDTKLIFLSMLNWKNLTYSTEKGVLLVKDRTTKVMKDRLDKHNLYRVSFNSSIMIDSSILDRAMTV